MYTRVASGLKMITTDSILVTEQDEKRLSNGVLKIRSVACAFITGAFSHIVQSPCARTHTLYYSIVE